MSNMIMTRDEYYKIKATMDENTCKQIIASMPIKTTDADSFYLQQELTKMEVEAIRHFPTDSSFRNLWKVVNLGPGLESISYAEILSSGRAEYVGDTATEIPNASATRQSTSIDVHTAKIKYVISFKDVQRMMMSGISIEAEKSRAAKDGMEYRFGNTAFFGDKVLNKKGYFSHAVDGNLVTIAPVAGAAGTNTWATKLPDEIYDDVKRLKTACDNNTNSQIDANVLGVHGENYNLLLLSHFPNITETIWERIQRRGIFEKIVKCPELKSVTHTGLVSAQNVAIAFSDRSDVFKLHIPVEFSTLPVQISGFDYITYCYGECAGLFLYRKYGGAYLLDV